MCGRFVFTFQHDNFIRQFGLRAAPALASSYNIAPQAAIPVIVRSRKTGDVECHLLNWGFAGGVGERVLHNARAETAHEKPTFAPSFATRRCIIPATGFYEWNEESRAPYYVSAPEGAYLAFAGLWRAERPDADAPPLLACAILTGAAQAPFDRVHHRFPVCLGADDYDLWLNPTTAPDTLKRLVTCAPPAGTRVWPVSRQVGRIAANDPDLILPIDAPDKPMSSQPGQSTLI